jgi:Citrate synthase
MAAVRVGLAVLATEEGESAPTAETGLKQAMRLLALTPTMVGAVARLRRGERPVLPRKSLGFAENFLTLLPGADTSAEAVRALDAALILRADNELNPSTFAARVTAATGADCSVRFFPRGRRCRGRGMGPTPGTSRHSSMRSGAPMRSRRGSRPEWPQGAELRGSGIRYSGERTHGRDSSAAWPRRNALARD